MQPFNASRWKPLSSASRTNQALFWLLLIGSIVGLFFSRIMPSFLGTGTGLACGIAIGFWAVLTVETLRKRDDPAVLAAHDLSMPRWLRRSWSRAAITYLFGLTLGYTATAWGYPWVLNKLFGTTSERTAFVTGWDIGGTRSCQGPELGRGLLIDSPGALCADSEASRLLRKGSSVRIVGPSSIFGMNVEGIYPVAAPP